MSSLHSTGQMSNVLVLDLGTFVSCKETKVSSLPLKLSKAVVHRKVLKFDLDVVIK